MSREQAFPQRKKVQVVTGVNRDTQDMMTGGDSVLGPYCYVSVQNCDQIAEFLRQRYPDYTIAVGQETEVLELPQLSLEDEKEWVMEYLNDPASW